MPAPRFRKRAHRRPEREPRNGKRHANDLASTQEMLRYGMRSILMAWIGLADLRAAEGDGAGGLGPVASTARARRYDEVVVLSGHSAERTGRYQAWLAATAGVAVTERREALSGPTELGEIYQAAVRAVDETRARHGRSLALSFHLS